VVNTSDKGKVTLVQFREGYNGRSVLDVLLYLSAHDVWTAAVSQGDDGGAKLVTADLSCTKPALPPAPAGLPFDPRTYTGPWPAPFNTPDSGPQTIARVREGHVEIIARGDVVPGSPTDLRITPTTEGGAPPDCAGLPGGGALSDKTVPGNALSGSASIVNVGEDTYFAYNADALAGFTGTEFNFGSGMAEYDMLMAANSPSLAAGATANLTTDAGEPLSIDYVHGIDAVSAVFMSNAIYNEYLISSALGANTHWVVTFPTKHYYTDAQAYAGVPRAPFGASFAAGRADTFVDATFHDQSGATEPVNPSEDCGFICPVLRVPLPFEVNVLSIMHSAADNSSGVLGSQLSSVLYPYLSLPSIEVAGWVSMDLGSAHEPHDLPGGHANGRALTLHGLPLTGFMVYNIINSNAAPGRLANYGGVFPHRSSVSCSNDDTGQVGDPCG
jgi:hypothetical protein